ncbi:MAG: hypothetical protein R3F60_24655 [bacterium]
MFGLVDHEAALPGGQLDAVGHDLDARQHEEGMAGRLELQGRAPRGPAGVSRRALRQPRGGEDEVQAGEGLLGTLQGHQQGADPLRQLGEDALDLAIHLGLGHQQAVVGLEDRLGLDEDRRARLGPAVHDPGDVGLVAGLDGQDVPILPDGVVLVLEEVGVLGGLDEPVDAVFELPVQTGHAAAQVSQLAAGVVGDAALLVEGVEQVAGQIGGDGEILSDLDQMGAARHHAVEEPAAPRGGVEVVADGGQVLGIEDAAAAGAGRRVEDVGHAGQRGEAAGVHQGAGLVDAGQALAQLPRVGGEVEGQGAIGGHGATAVLGQPSEHARPLEVAQGLLGDDGLHGAAC